MSGRTKEERDRIKSQKQNAAAKKKKKETGKSSSSSKKKVQQATETAKKAMQSFGKTYGENVKAKAAERKTKNTTVSRDEYDNRVRQSYGERNGLRLPSVFDEPRKMPTLSRDDQKTALQNMRTRLEEAERKTVKKSTASSDTRYNPLIKTPTKMTSDTSPEINNLAEAALRKGMQGVEGALVGYSDRQNMKKAEEILTGEYNNRFVPGVKGGLRMQVDDPAQVARAKEEAKKAGYDSLEEWEVAKANELVHSNDDFYERKAALDADVEAQGYTGIAKYVPEVAEMIGSMVPTMAVGAASGGIGSMAGLTGRAAWALNTVLTGGEISNRVSGQEARQVYDALVSQNQGSLTREQYVDAIKKANTAGELVGIAEAGTEALFGGIAFLGKGAVDMAAAKFGWELLSPATKTSIAAWRGTTTGRILTAVAERTGGALGEGVEEAIMTLAQPAIEKTVAGLETDVTISDILHDFGMGAAVSLVLGVPVSVAESADTISAAANTNAAKKEYVNVVAEKAKELVEAGKMTPSAAQTVVQEVRDILSGRGSLLTSEVQRNETKVSSETKEVYSSLKEAHKALKKQAEGKSIGSEVSVAVVENGVPETWKATVTDRGIENMQLTDTTTEEQQAYAAKAQRMAAASTATERSGIQYNVKENVINEVSELGKALNREVEFFSDRSAVHGYEQDGKIFVNANSSQSPAAAVIAHEMTHLLENTSSYKKLQGMMQNFYKSSIEDKRAEIFSNYKAAGVNLTEEQADYEVMAMFVEEKLLTDYDTIRELTRTDRTLAEKIKDWINKVIQKITGNKEQRFLMEARDMWNRALQEEQSNKKAPRDGAEKRYSISDKFVRNLEKWDRNGRPDKKRLFVGTASDALKSIGIGENSTSEPMIYWNTTKLRKILTDHPEINLETVKSLPNVLENPVIILENPDKVNRIVMFGDVYGTNDIPVMVVLELSRKEQEDVMIDNLFIVNSYTREQKEKGVETTPEYRGKDTTQTIINNYRILYTDPNKKRTREWMADNRLQLPLGFIQYGPINKVSYFEKDVNGGVSFEDKAAPKTPFQLQLEDLKDQMENRRHSIGRSKDAAYMDAVNRGDMADAQRMVDEAAKAAGYSHKMYHGAKGGGGFTVFRGWQYFTEKKAYAERYAKRDVPESLYSVYVKMEKPFDTRDDEARDLFYDIRNEYGLTELQEDGLPDWTDGYDITDYIEENDLDYDAILLNEGGDFVDGKPVSRGISYVIRDSAQIKSADPVTYDDNGNVIPLSERFRDENDDIRWSIGRKDIADKDMRDLIKTENRKMREVFFSRAAYDRESLWDMIEDEEKHIVETGSYRYKVVQDIIDFAYETGFRYINEEMEPVNSLGKVSIYVPERYRGEMASLGGIAEVNKQMFGSGILFTYKENKNALDDAYATLQAENQGIMPETTEPSEQVQSILDVFGRGSRQSLRELDSDEYNPFAERDTPYRSDIEDTVHDAMDRITAMAVKKIAAANREQGQQDVNRWVSKKIKEEAQNYTVGSVVELEGERGTVAERITKGRSVTYIVDLDNGERRENVKPEEFNVGVTPTLHFDELPKEQQVAWQEPPAGWDMSRDLADVAPLPIDMKEYREILYENGITVGVRKLNEWFKRNGWLKKIDRHYFPTEKALKEGYFQRERYGNKITESGQQYFLDLFTRNVDTFIDPEDSNNLVLPGNKPEKDSPTEERNYLEMLYEYEEEIVDTGQDYRWAESLTGKGVTYSKDYARNFDAAAKYNPNARKHLQDLFVRPLEAAKADYAKEVRSKLTEMHDKMKELGIRKDTKESQAVQWIGEGFYQDKFGETHEYTIEMLKEEFPKNWKNIQDAATYFRHVYDDYLNEINAARELIYPHPLEDAQDRVAAYMLRRDRATDKIIELRATISEMETVLSVKKEEYANAAEEDKAALQKSIRYNEDRLSKTKISLGDYISRRSKYVEKVKQIQADIDSGDVLRNKRIVPRKDYFHHFQEMSDSLGDVFRLSRNSTEIDPRLEGTSGYTEPKSKFSGITLHRNNGRYKADAIEGFIEYAQVGEYMKHIDPVISQFRSHIAGMANATKDSRNANKLIRWLVQWTNDLAGKTNPADRFLQDVIGREAVQFARKINSRAKANAVVGNLNSATAQIFNLPNLVAHVTDPKAYVEGFADFCKFIAREKSTRDIVKESGFLNERYLDDVIKSFDEKAIKKPEKVAAWTLTVGDRYSTALIWFVAHHEAVNKGIKNPIEYADNITRRCVAGRGIGEIPITQKSNITQIFAPFQIEVNNAWQLYKEKLGGIKTANSKIEKALSFTQFLLILIVNFILNTVTDLLIHRRVAFDPIYVLFQCIADWMNEDEDEKTNWAERFIELMGRESGEIISNMPFGSLIAYYAFNNQWARENLFGEQDPTRFGVGNTSMEWIVGFIDSLASGEDIVDDAVGFLTTFVMPFGGKQTERIWQGLVDTGVLPQVKWGWKEGLTLGRVDAPGSYNANGEFQFPLHTVKTDFGQWVTNVLFGKYATDEGQKYLGKDYENSTLWQNIIGFNKTKERSALSERATTVLKDLAKSGADVFEVYDTLRAIQDAEDTYSKNNVLRYSDLSQDEKAAIILGYMTQKDDVESTEKKINAILGVGLTVDDYLDIRNMYTIINKNEDIQSASDKANQFVKELAAAGYTSEQIAGIYEGMSFWQNIPANIDKFTEMTASGLDSETAIMVQDAFDALEPLPGKTQVTALQKVEAIANLGLSSDKEMLALSQAMGKEQYAKYVATTDYGVTAKTWVDFQNALSAADNANNANGSYDKDEKAVALESMDISNDARAALWQSLDNYLGNESKTTSWKADRNPYSSSVGADIVEKYMEAKAGWTVTAPEASADVSLDSMVSPLADGGRISSGFGYRNTGIAGASTNHQAVDIAAPTGTDVGATIAGVVTRVSSSGGYGNSVEITSTDADGNKIVTKYSHLDNFGVQVGDTIAQGQKIGEVGSTGTSSGSHLDFKLGVNGQWVDPSQYLDLAAAGIVDGSNYTIQTGTGGSAAVMSNSYSGGSSSSGGGNRSGSSGGVASSGGNRIATVSSSRKTNSGQSSAGSSGSVSSGSSSVSARNNGNGSFEVSRSTGELTLPSVSRPAAVTGRSVQAPTYSAMGLTLPRAGSRTPIRSEISVATTQRTGRTGGSLWDPDVLG